MLVESCGELQAPLRARPGLTRRVGPVGTRVGGSDLGAQADGLGLVRRGQLQGGDPLTQPGQRRQRLRELPAWKCATTAATGWVPGSENAVVMQGILSGRTDNPVRGITTFRALCRTIFRNFSSTRVRATAYELRLEDGSATERRALDAGVTSRCVVVLATVEQWFVMPS